MSVLAMGRLRDVLVGVLYFGVRTLVLVNVMGRTLWLAVLWEEEFLGLMLALEKEEFLGLMLALEKEEFLGLMLVLEKEKKFLGLMLVLEKEGKKFLGWAWVFEKEDDEFLGWTWVVGEEEEGCQLKREGRKGDRRMGGKKKKVHVREREWKVKRMEGGGDNHR